MCGASCATPTAAGTVERPCHLTFCMSPATPARFVKLGSGAAPMAGLLIEGATSLDSLHTAQTPVNPSVLFGFASTSVTPATARPVSAAMPMTADAAV